MQLCQGNSGVSEYIAKFEELCKFSTIYQRNRDEAWKCAKFEGGLREDILAAVGPMEIRDFLEGEHTFSRGTNGNQGLCHPSKQMPTHKGIQQEAHRY